MNVTSLSNIAQLLENEVAEAVAKASEVILFGSRAARTHREWSDYDLLCVGEGPRVRTQEFDVVWITPNVLASDEWLGSELACHVAKYGRWLKGRPDWGSRCFASSQAIERKRRAIVCRARALSKHVDRVSEELVWRCTIRIRRDVQRLKALLEQEPVPTTPSLDEAWAAGVNGEVTRLLRSDPSLSQFVWLEREFGRCDTGGVVTARDHRRVL